jgi:hypothetical protein
VLHGLPRCAPAARFWSERAFSEYAAVPAISQAVLALVREGGSLDELAAMMHVSQDEIRHTELSRDMAEAFGGYCEDVPECIDFDPKHMGDPLGWPLAFWVIGTGCVSETLSLELMRQRMHHTTHPVAAAVLADIVKDEAVHSRLGWSIASRIVPTLSQAHRRELSEYASEYVGTLAKSFISRDMAPAAKARARRLRMAVASRGLGACPPDEADATFRKTVTDIMRPRFAKIGLKLPASVR